MNAMLGTLLLSLLPQGSPMDSYRKLDFTPRKGRFDETCRTRIALEYALIQAGDPAPLREALGDGKRDVRAFAAGALGILGDKESIPRLVELARKDPAQMVRGQALLALGWLKTGGEVIQEARTRKKGRAWNVWRMARIAEAQLKSPVDFGAEVRKAYAAPFERSEMDVARMGRKAPGFSAVDENGKAFKLNDRIGKKVVVLTFQVADW